MSQGAASLLDEGTLRRWFVNAWRPTTNEERYRLSPSTMSSFPSAPS
jgi:hypothetical protein